MSIKSIKLCAMCKKMYIEKMLDFLFFNLYLETYDLHYFLNRYVRFTKIFLEPLDHF